MKSIYLILGLIAISQCQILVLNNWVSTTNGGVSQTYQKPSYDWSTYLDFAVYGWFKIDPTVILTKQASLFHLTSNTDGGSTVNQKVGDYSLGVLYKDSKLSIGTYASPLVNFYNANLNVRSQDLGKWTFFYVGYSGTAKKLYHHFEFNGVYFTNGSITGVTHVKSSFYKLFVGLTNKYSKFPGQISKVYIHAGTGAYRQTNFNQIIPTNPYQVIQPNSVILYTECNYAGTSYDLFKQSNIPLSTIKSIFIPSGYTVTLKNLSGQSFVYTASIPCLSYKFYGISAKSG